MLYFITILLVVIIISIFVLIRNQWALMDGQVIANKNQKFMSTQLDAVLATTRVIESLYKVGANNAAITKLPEVEDLPN